MKFYSVKLINLAQQNYAVYEKEVFAGDETTLQHRDIRKGIHFQWKHIIRDVLLILITWKYLTRRQACRMDEICEVNFKIICFLGV